MYSASALAGAAGRKHSAPFPAPGVSTSVIDALTLGLRPAASSSSSTSWRGQRLVDVDWDDQNDDDAR